MRSLEFHDMSIRVVYDGRIHYGFSRIRLFFKNIHSQLHYLITICRINKSSIQHTVKHKFQSVSFTRQSINTDKEHFFLPTYFLGSPISSRSYAVIMCIHRIDFRMTTEHTIHLHFSRTTLPCRIRFINQLYIREITDGCHKSLMTLHRRGRPPQPCKLHHIPFSLQA